MRVKEASGTAHSVAMQRAAHQLIDTPRVFEDPLAVPILGGEPIADRIRGRRTKLERRFVSGLRAYFALRARLAEDVLAREVACGVSQYVVLGAGLDTFAYRSPYAGLRVFEVDHPGTQDTKRRMLAAAGIVIPPTVSYVPVDFERDDLLGRLSDAGFSRDHRAGFTMLGVTMYLRPETVAATLAAVGACAPGSWITFDYFGPSAATWSKRFLVQLLAWRVRFLGEPWRASFEPRQMSATLRGGGFREISDRDCPTLNQQCHQGRIASFGGHGVVRLVIAST